MESIGRDRSDKDISDWANVTWGKLASPKADCVAKRQTKAEYWEKRLTQMDGKTVLPDVQATPTRRKRTENDTPHEERTSIRRKTNSQPLSMKTNAIEASTSVLTPPRSPDRARPWEVISGNALVWFAQQAGKNSQLCPSIASWKQHIARERRLHSFDSLLLGCGSASEIQEGVIVLDECDEKIDRWITHVREYGVTELVHPIVVYGCRSGVLFKLK